MSSQQGRRTFISSIASPLRSPLPFANAPVKLCLGIENAVHVRDDPGGLKSKPIFPSSIHPRRREERARRVLRRVLEQEAPQLVDPTYPPAKSNSKAALLNALAEAGTLSLANRKGDFQPNDLAENAFFQLTLEDENDQEEDVGRSLGRNGPSRLEEEVLALQEQRGASFHGYQQEECAFLDVAGAAIRIPRTTTRQLRETKLRVMKTKKHLENQRTQEILAVLQEQQAYTRAAVRQHQQLLDAKIATAATPGVVPVQELTLGNGRHHDGRPRQAGGRPEKTSERSAGDHSVISEAMSPSTILEEAIAATTVYDEREQELQSLRQRIHQQKAAGHVARQQSQELHRQQKRLAKRMNARRPSFLATLQLDTGSSVSLRTTVNNADGQAEGVAAIDSTFNCGPVTEAVASVESNTDVENEGVRRRLGDRQREVFINSAVNGLFFGGGFIAKKAQDKHERRYTNGDKSSRRTTEAASDHDSLEAVLGTCSAPILSAATANELALRRRAASAGRRRHRSPKRKDQQP
ncbi:hypothetical protein BBJ28_00016908 [Nothophytophthora sp. Chile5]|nr:hypothetical protein BBJ28_00016908 [Nothophytophthora sp. Chile5]